MQPVTCRPATPADSPAVAEIWYAGWQDGHLGHVPDELLAVRTPESFRERSAQRVSDTTVALVEGAIAGFSMVAGDEVVPCHRYVSGLGTPRGSAGRPATE